MITVTDRRYNTLCQASFDLPEGLIAYDDVFEQDLDTAISTYQFTVDKTHEDVQYIQVGCYVFANDDGNIRTFEIMSMEENSDTKTVYCEDAGLDLIGEQLDAFKADMAHTIQWYINQFTQDSGWEVGVNELPDRALKLEWEGTDSATKRLRQLAGRFGVEISYRVELLNGRVHRRLIDVQRKIGQDRKVRMEYGFEVSKITKKSSIENLATGLIAKGDNVTLDGYNFKETDRYKLIGNTIVDKIEGARWSRHHNASNGYIVKVYDSEAKTQKTLADAVVNQLKKRAYPEIEYTVDIDMLPETLNIGDTVAVVDHEFKPQLVIEGRVMQIQRSFSDRNFGKVVISNIKETPDRLDEKVSRLSKLLQEKLFDWNSIPPVMAITSTNGTIFKDNHIQTKLIAQVTKNTIDITQQFSFIWKRNSRYDTSQDNTWNTQHQHHRGHELQLSIADVEQEATFICEAYKEDSLIDKKSIVIKDFVVGRYKQSTAPQHAENGSIWTDTSVEPNVLKILKNGEWIPIVQDLTQYVKTERYETDNEQKKEELIIIQQRYNNELKKIIDSTSELQATLETKLTEKDLEDLRGKLADTQTRYEQLLQAQSVIEGLGERVTAFEVNVQQSQALINALSTYFSFSEDGVLTGRKGSSMQTLMTNDRLSFLDGGKEVAYISNQQLYILSGVFLETLIIANHIMERLGTDYTIINWVGGR
ncbi:MULTISPECIES: phage tail spike protein [unclassified Granulicatella]|uniref:phage tail spike protein n=1 Tax=unclassified Granulicatella TaxID=2630493 RepID=UPI0010732BB3|nr:MULTISPECIES: phage tail spike protein [unclassified Granulicatella]MBF0780518.1 phage tail protein [Granulicatella sp. 19428wC4_WM01]TFU95332.1 hypothetical protein E4T68_05360 [Granulicatella sp. WM01]